MNDTSKHLCIVILEPLTCSAGPLSLHDVDLLVVGGETGEDARPCNVRWIREIIWQCQDKGVPVHIKQLGSQVMTNLPPGESWPGGNGLSGSLKFSGDGYGNYHVIGLKDTNGSDMSEWPADLRVREVPA